MSGSAASLTRPLRSRLRMRKVVLMTITTALVSLFAAKSFLELSAPKLEDWPLTVARLNADPLAGAELPPGFSIKHSFARSSITPEVAEVLGGDASFIYAGMIDLDGGAYLRSRISFVVHPDLSDANATFEGLSDMGESRGSKVASYRIGDLGELGLPERGLCWYLHGMEVECYLKVGSVIVSGETMPFVATSRPNIGPDWFSSPEARDARALLEAGLRHLFTLEPSPRE